MKFCFRSLFTKLTYILYAMKERKEVPLLLVADLPHQLLQSSPSSDKLGQ
jgi:hypothetical protein